MNFDNLKSGLEVIPRTINAGNNIQVKYTGTLSNSEDLYLHFGSSYLNEWVDVSEIKMTKRNDGSFIANIDIMPGNKINLTFRNSFDEWDNNFGKDYSLKIKK